MNVYTASSISGDWSIQFEKEYVYLQVWLCRMAAWSVQASRHSFLTCRCKVTKSCAQPSAALSVGAPGPAVGLGV